MALLPVLRYPDPRLHTTARPVMAVDPRIRQLVGDMLTVRRTFEAELKGIAQPVTLYVVDKSG